MKKLVTVIAVLALSQLAQARQTQCERLADALQSSNSEELVEEVRSFQVKSSQNLTSLQIKHVWDLAKYQEENMDYDGYEDIDQAIDVLRDDSEGGDLIYSVMRFEDEVFTAITFWPGGNPVGLVFKGAKIIASNGDGDYSCL